MPLLLAALFGMSMSAYAGTGPLLSVQDILATPLLRVDGDDLAQRSIDVKGRPLQFAVPVAIHITPTTHGRWTRIGQMDIWRLRLGSPGAYSLNLALTDLYLPQGASLRLYDRSGVMQQGPYSERDNRADGQLWTALVPGAELLLELAVPAAARPQLSMAITQLNHGFRSLRATAKAGSCNVDAACPTGDQWTDAIRATARITVGGQRLCTAVLLNNTRRDGDPLALTADHCGIGESSGMPASSVVAYWNFQSSECDGSADGSLRQNQSGASLLARGATADFSLIRLDQRPPATYAVFYAGWDASGTAPGAGVSVHHPRGDEKSISSFSQSARRRTANVDGNQVQSWEVVWSQGVTEPGSSGSGLWNEDHRVVGQLSGGNSSCEEPTRSDVFGRLDVAWQAGSQPANQLRSWLDPEGSGELAIDGLDPGTANLKASNDEFRNLPADSEQLSLDVLLNDQGVWPLRIVSARAGNGTIISSNSTQLIYRWSANSHSDTIFYTAEDRWGRRASATVALSRNLREVRGGEPGLLLLAALVGLARRRACTRML